MRSEVPLPVKTANTDTVMRVRATGAWEEKTEVAYVNGKWGLETFCQDGQECMCVLCMWRGEETSLNGLAQRELTDGDPRSLTQLFIRQWAVFKRY